MSNDLHHIASQDRTAVRSNLFLPENQLPHVAVIIPHYNYSDVVGEALISVQQQSYGNFTCIVVDDCSSEAHFQAVSGAVAALHDGRFKLIRNGKNCGMVHSIYRGLDETDAALFAVLDPDDRYSPGFVDRMLGIHLAQPIFCPIVSCDQFLFNIGDGIISSTYKSDGYNRLETGAYEAEQECFLRHGFHRFIPPHISGWHWTSTSSMMFRSAAAKLIRPNRELAYKGNGDDYLAAGAHMLGGSIILREPLVYRGIHSANDYLAPGIFSMFQRNSRKGATSFSEVAKRDVVEAFLQNGGLDWFDVEDFRNVVRGNFGGSKLTELVAAVPQISAILGTEV